MKNHNTKKLCDPPAGAEPPGFALANYPGVLDPDLEAPVELLFALRACMQRVNAGLIAQLGPEALSPGRMQLMMVLSSARSPVQQTRLVATLQVSRASLSELLDTLTRDQLIATSPDPAHGRRLLVKLTRKGRETARTQLRENATQIAAAFSQITAAEQRSLTSLLRRLGPPTAEVSSRPR